MWLLYSPAGYTFSPDRMREVLKRVSIVYMGTSINIQLYRHIAIAISRQYLQGRSVFAFNEEDITGEIDEDHDDIIDQ